MTRLAVIGASGHGSVVADLAMECGWQRIELFDDCWPRRTSCLHWPIVGNVAAFNTVMASYAAAIVAIGNNKNRKRLGTELSKSSISLPTLVHPTACISSYSQLGTAVVVMANVVVNANSTIGCG